MRLLIIVFTMLCAPAFAQTRFYDKNGNYQGKIEQQGSREVIRDKNGNTQGYYEHQGDRTVLRDKNGNMRGYSTAK